MEKNYSYGGWQNCVRLSNGEIEMIATTDVGPRVIRLGFINGQNLFKEVESEIGKTGGSEWRGYGGHRLWHAPEAMPRTYAPDNQPIDCDWDGTTLRLTQATEESTGVQKQINITLDPEINRVKLTHRITNRNLWTIDLSPWCLTVMAPGGRAIFPQEEYKPHPDYLLPARPLVLWHYTDMQDPRWNWGTKYIQLKQDPSPDVSKQKIGLLNKKGWCAYTLNGEVFLKRFGFTPDAEYPDYNCNNETFTNPDMLEVETLGPMTKLEPGEATEQVEQWFLFKKDIGASEESIDDNLLPLVEKTASFAP
ncbi:MAG: DUF4380 domain-containing protein [Verrucomicrobia bacterium]|nr:DUF4380 domain-containing protein [Verrucomicrobiota bacterium]MCF7708288.1 DUF4380 domain-containing protein [Verrucomicrobiota bacterium]